MRGGSRQCAWRQPRWTPISSRPCSIPEVMPGREVFWHTGHLHAVRRDAGSDIFSQCHYVGLARMREESEYLPKRENLSPRGVGLICGQELEVIKVRATGGSDYPGAPRWLLNMELGDGRTGRRSSTTGFLVLATSCAGSARELRERIRVSSTWK